MGDSLGAIVSEKVKPDIFVGVNRNGERAGTIYILGSWEEQKYTFDRTADNMII